MTYANHAAQIRKIDRQIDAIHAEVMRRETPLPQDPRWERQRT